MSSAPTAGWGSGATAARRSATRREYVPDDDGDGPCEVHVNTLGGFWSLLRSWPRTTGGTTQEGVPLYLGFFEFIHNVRARGKRRFGALIGLLLAPPRNPS